MIHSAFANWVRDGATEAQISELLESHQFPNVVDSKVTFVFRGEAEKVELRHWIYGLPTAIPMSRLGQTDLWYRVMQFPEKSRIEYKFGVIQGGHEKWVLDPLNPNIATDPFGGNSVVHCQGYEVPEWSEPNSEVPHGQMHDLEIDSHALGGRRTIRVYVPPKYREYRRYRLLVAHDGDDYVKYSRLTTVLDNLIHRLEIPPLVVALSNPHDRLREYADEDRHARHIVEEVIPALESRYRLITAASGRCLMGASFGAVAAMATAWRFPNTFESLLLQSGSFAFTDIGEHTRSPAFDPVVEFMNEFRKNPSQPAKRAFVSCGVYESLIYENRSLIPFLHELGVKTKYVESRDGHNWENWRDRLRDGLTWLFHGPLWVTYM